VLKGIDPLLTPDLLRLLAQMGHGDVLAVVDRNYPAFAAGAPVVDLGVDLATALSAICTVLPIDQLQDHPVRHMLTDDGADGPALPAVLQVLAQAEGRVVGAQGLDRHAFYPAARGSFAVVRTTEERPYACVLLAKGVV
jgi:L-fucose mutarotase